MESTDQAEFVTGPNDDSMNSYPESDGHANNAESANHADCDGHANNDGVEDGARDEVGVQDAFEAEGTVPEAAEPSPQDCMIAFKEDVETLRKRPRSETIANTIPEREVFQRINSMIRVCDLAAQQKAQELIGLRSLSNRIRRVCRLIVSHEIVSTNASQFTWKLRARAVLPDSSPISISDFAKRVFFETENNVEVGEWSASKIAGSQPVDEFQPLPAFTYH
jgi:hypothetical protein